MFPIFLDFFAGIFTWTTDDYIAAFKVVATFIGLGFLYMELRRQKARTEAATTKQQRVRFHLPPKRDTITGSSIPDPLPDSSLIQAGAKQRWRCSRCKGILDKAFRLRSNRAVCSAC